MVLTPRYTWEESETTIALQISLPGTALKYVDIYVSDLVIKVNAHPYVLLLDLLDAVDETSAVVKRNAATHVLHITIHKIQEKLWNQLTFADTKAAIKDRRLASMERQRQSEASLAEKRKDRKHREEKQTLRAQMAVDDTGRQILSDLKAEEKAREEQAMYETFRDLQIKQQKTQQQKPDVEPTVLEDNQSTHEIKATDIQVDKSILKPVQTNTTTRKKSTKAKTVSFDIGPDHHQDEELPIVELGVDGSFDIAMTPVKTILSSNNQSESEMDFCEKNTDSTPTPFVDATVQPSSVQNVNESVVEVVELPAPRPPTEVDINFSTRLFPTPMRESQAADEENWLIKNRKHLKKHQGLRHPRGDPEDIYDISENDPMWLKAKADDFYRSRDYRSALNAYGDAISLATEDQQDLLVTCLSNRAACSLQLAEFVKCKEGCTKALSMLPDTPSKPGSDGIDDVPAQRLKQYRMKLKLLVRRGTAFCRLGRYTEAKADYGVALTMDNQNPALQQDYFELLQLDNARKLKEQGDDAFKLNDLNAAIQHYDESLRLNSLSIATLSNRAACHLRRHELQQCVDDCSRALELLQQPPPDTTTDGNNGLAFFSVGPVAGSAKRRAWVIKTMVRRGTALAAMHRYEQAMSDYDAAVQLDPSNNTLKGDLAKIQEKVKNCAKDVPLDDPVSTETLVAP